MQDSGKTSWLLKKSYEIAYAVFRISAKMEEREFAGYFKNAAAMLLGAVAQEDYAQALRATASLEHFTRFAVDVSIMGIANGDVMVNEINGLAAALREVPAKGDLIGKDDRDIDLSAFFSQPEFGRSEETTIHISAEDLRKELGKKSGKESNSGKNFDSGKDFESGKSFDSGKTESGKNESGNDESSGNGSGGINGILKSAIRQSAILERIRQIGNCRIKDIQEILPNASERTLRYDLQTLVEQDLIDKIGSGGPAVFYRIKEVAGIPSDGDSGEFESQENSG